jgi:hypothetical protein
VNSYRYASLFAPEEAQLSAQSNYRIKINIMRLVGRLENLFDF